MGKLTKTQQHELREILRGMKAAQAYIFSATTELTYKTKVINNVAPLGNQYHGCRLEPGFTLTCVDKHIGSDIAQLHTTIRQLDEFLGDNL